MNQPANSHSSTLLSQAIFIPLNTPALLLPYFLGQPFLLKALEEENRQYNSDKTGFFYPCQSRRMNIAIFISNVHLFCNYELFTLFLAPTAPTQSPQHRSSTPDSISSIGSSASNQVRGGMQPPPPGAQQAAAYPGQAQPPQQQAGYPQQPQQQQQQYAQQGLYATNAAYTK